MNHTDGIAQVLPLEVTPPGVTKKTVRILAIRSDVKLADIQKLGTIPPERIMLPALEEEEAPADLFPEPKIAEPETEPAPPPEVEEEKTPDDVTEDDIANMNAVFRICWHFWEMQPIDVCWELGYRTTMDLLAAGAKKFHVSYVRAVLLDWLGLVRSPP